MLNNFSDFLFRRLLDALSITGPKLSVLIYHRVLAEPDPMRPWETDAKQFRNHLEWISDVFNVIPLHEAVEQLKHGTLPPRSLAITFDDGYLDNATVALDILKEHHFTATFFCTTAFLEGGLMWNDTVIEALRLWPNDSISLPDLEVEYLPTRTIVEKALSAVTILNKLKYEKFSQRNNILNKITPEVENMPKRLMMSADDIKGLHSAGMEIGGHTHSHPILANLSPDKAKEQIINNKLILEETLGQSISLFAYPNGKPDKDYNHNHIKFVQEAGYKAAVSTTHGVNTTISDLYQINRFTPWDNSKHKFLIRLALNTLKY